MIIYKMIFHLNAIIKKVFLKMVYGKKIKFGKKVSFRRRFNLAIDKNGFVKIGDNVFFNNDCSINAMDEIVIGSDSIFGESVKIYDHNHVFKDKSKLIKNQGFKTGKISIGSNCWIGSNVIILKGVTIGNNCVIGAGCIIDKDISSNSIVKGKREYIIEGIN